MVQHLHVLEINYCLYRLISTSSATRVYWFQSLTSALHNENSLKMHSVITSRKSKNDRQYNNQKTQNNTLTSIFSDRRIPKQEFLFH